MENNKKIIENKILDLIDEYSKLKFRKLRQLDYYKIKRKIIRCNQKLNK